MNTITRIAITDDQQLFLKSLSMMVSTFKSFEVILEAMHGEDLIRKLGRTEELPDIALIDVSMPVMNGQESVLHLRRHFPAIRTIALSMKDDERSILEMVDAGCCAYLLKDIHPLELERALIQVSTDGYYNGDVVNIKYRSLRNWADEEERTRLTVREAEFLILARSELTYKEIAAKMSLSNRTIDGYREALFDKLKVCSRVGMVLEGLRRGLITL